MKLKYRMELDCLKILAVDICIDIYHDYDESELTQVAPSVQQAWLTGKSLVENSLKQKGE